MKETLSYAEIAAEFDSQWVLVEDPDTAPDLTVKSGAVISHSKDRDEVYRKARDLRPRHAAILYVGTLPENTAVVL